MKQLLFLLLCVTSLAHAQSNLPPTFSPGRLSLYGRAPAMISGPIVIVGGPVAVTAVAYSAPSKSALLAGNQPVLVMQGNNYYINWSAAQATALASQGSVWLELTIGGIPVRAQTVYFEFTNRPVSISENTIGLVNVSVVTRADINQIRDSLVTAVDGSVDNAAGSAIIATTQAGIALNAATDANNAKTSALDSRNRGATSEANSFTSSGAAQAYATAANGSRVGAGTSETNAAGSATNAQTARSGAETARSSAETARDGSINAATSAGQSAQQSQNSATTAGTYSTSANVSATNARNSEVLAGTYSTSANASRVSAAQSETNAAASATSALASKNSAATSETNAATSASQANTSRINAGTSEANAATSASNALSTYNATVSATQNCTIALGNLAISATIDMGQCPNVFAYGTLTGNTTLTIINSAPGRSLYLELVQGGAGSFVGTFPATVRFPGGAAIDWATTAGTYNAFSLVGRPLQGSFNLTGFYSKQ